MDDLATIQLLPVLHGVKVPDYAGREIKPGGKPGAPFNEAHVTTAVADLKGNTAA